MEDGVGVGVGLGLPLGLLLVVELLPQAISRQDRRGKARRNSERVDEAEVRKRMA